MNEVILENPYVSVIVPIYNVEKYLDAAIESICNQTYKNIQVILVDDGSTDKSGIICDKWREKDERILVIHKKNGGASEARNEGLKAAVGKLVYFVDADDSIDPLLLSEVISEMSDDVDMVSFGYRLVADDREACNVSFQEKIYPLHNETEKINFILGDFFKYRIGWNVWNRVFRKRIIDEHSIEFVDPQQTFAEDQLFCLCYLLYCRKIVCLNRCYYNYFQRDNSIMGTYKVGEKSYFAQKSEMARYLFQYCAEHKEGHFLQDFESVIHFLLVDRVIQESLLRENYKMKKVKQIIKEDIENHFCEEYWNLQLMEFVRNEKLIKTNYSMLQRIEKIECAKWLLNKPNIFFLFCALRKIQEKR